MTGAPLASTTAASTRSCSNSLVHPLCPAYRLTSEGYLIEPNSSLDPSPNPNRNPNPSTDTDNKLASCGTPSFPEGIQLHREVAPTPNPLSLTLAPPLHLPLFLPLLLPLPLPLPLHAYAYTPTRLRLRLSLPLWRGRDRACGGRGLQLGSVIYTYTHSALSRYRSSPKHGLCGCHQRGLLYEIHRSWVRLRRVTYTIIKRPHYQ